MYGKGLKLEYRVKIWKWLEDHEDEARQTPARSLAATLSKELGIAITETNVGGIRREMGIKTTTAKGQGIRGLLSFVAKRNRVLAECLGQLYRELNVPVPESINNLIKEAEKYCSQKDN